MTIWSSPEAGRGAGVDFFGSNYPFVAPGPDLRYILSDFWLGYSLPATPPLFIQQLLHFGRPLLLEPPGPATQHQSDVVVVDSLGAIVCDTRLAETYLSRSFGDRFYLHEWLFPDKVCRIVQHTKLVVAPDVGYRETEQIALRETQQLALRVTQQLAGPFPIHLHSASGQLDERTHELLPTRVASITVGNDVLSGNIVLIPGFNMLIEPDVASVRAVPSLSPALDLPATGLASLQSTLVLSAAPGAGLGTYPGCVSNEEGLLTLNQVAPDATGNLLIAATDCLDVSAPLLAADPSHQAPSALRFSNQCQVCCSCAEYLDVYNEEAVVNYQLTSTLSLLAQATDGYTNLISYWEQQQGQLNILSLAFTDAHGFDSTVVSLPAIPGAGFYAVCHASTIMPANLDLAPLRLVFSCVCSSPSGGGGSVPPSLVLTSACYGTTARSMTDSKGVLTIGGSWPTFTADWPYVGAGTSLDVFLFFTLPVLTSPADLANLFNLSVLLTIESPAGTPLNFPATIYPYAVAAVTGISTVIGS